MNDPHPTPASTSRASIASKPTGPTCTAKRARSTRCCRAAPGCSTPVAAQATRRRTRRRGHHVTAVDLDPVLVAEARKRSPPSPCTRPTSQRWICRERFDAVVAAGNVLIFVARGTERQVLGRIAHHLVPGGIFVTGFATDYEYTVDEFERRSHRRRPGGASTASRRGTLRPWHDRAG
ncbi:methyltransferase domain-containing protein, partial [Rhodococcus hoagii]|nr:methyltransferase domain-containing protein [Prescottella equi]